MGGGPGGPGRPMLRRAGQARLSRKSGHRANRPQGRWARSLKKASSAVLRPLATMWAASTPPARSCWRLAATRSTRQWPAPSGRATPGRGHRRRPGRPGPCGPRRRPGSGPDGRRARGRLVPAGRGRRSPPWRGAQPDRARGGAAPAGVHGREDPGVGIDRASGTQSATSMTSVTPGVVVTRMSVSGIASSSTVVPRPGHRGRRAPPTRRGPVGRRPACRGRRRTRRRRGPGWRRRRRDGRPRAGRG